MSAAPAGPSVLLDTYLVSFAALFGDHRTRATFAAIIYGILTAGSLLTARISAPAPLLAARRDEGRRVRRFGRGESTARSDRSAATLVTALRDRGVATLTTLPAEQELWLVLAGSELRKPAAQALPHLMKGRALDGQLVPGYRTLNGLGVTPQRRTLLYHRLFSSTAPDFTSEPHEVQTALTTVAPVVNTAEHPRTVTGLLDSGFDDVAVWRTIWEYDQHFVCRAAHLDRQVRYQTRSGRWHGGPLQAAVPHLRGPARVETVLTVRLNGQPVAKRQPVTVSLQSLPLEVAYDPNVRWPGGAATTRWQRLWLLVVRVEDSPNAPWYLLTDWPVTTPAEAQRVFQMYRQRWAGEEAFAFLKTCVGWEAVQVLDLAGSRMLVALGWGAAGYLYEIDGSWEWADVELLARLGGVPHKDRKPGKKVLAWGLARVLDWLVTGTLLAAARAAPGGRPSGIAALLGEEPDG